MATRTSTERNERRYAPLVVEWRQDGASGRPVVRGTVIRYGDTAQLPGFRERFEPGAFGPEIAVADVLLNVLHERSRPLARTTLGGGLVLTDSPTALEARAELPQTSEGNDVAELLRLGVLAGLSAEFVAVSESFVQGVRLIEAAQLRGLALVDRPAYSSSHAAIAERYAAEIAEHAAARLQPPPRRRRVWL